MSEIEMTKAAADVLAERRRQIEVEGWTPEHDDEYDAGELSDAAGCYALVASIPEEHRPRSVPRFWPLQWRVNWWKPTTQRRDLVKAGALILAEIERLDRAAAPEAKAVPASAPEGSVVQTVARIMNFDLIKQRDILMEAITSIRSLSAEHPKDPVACSIAAHQIAESALLAAAPKPDAR